MFYVVFAGLGLGLGLERAGLGPGLVTAGLDYNSGDISRLHSADETVVQWMNTSHLA